ncbi:MAG: hypothetical protein Q8Q09_15025 [Deltaproteobacteria bacterium]|nr:hypothetical protein [Deltaproteobacteria bacterium]
MKKLVVAAFMGFSMFAASGLAMAQDAPAAAAGGAQPTRTQEFNFTDELVTGQLVRPDGESSRLRRRGPGISLIRIREHFVPEMLKSVENL